ncbi:MAG: hypothetical protein QOD61_2773 [Solirubrobacteraceae bacterium]|nr:hypothetical protein [Solirubrobacteraceae bacterium]
MGAALVLVGAWSAVHPGVGRAASATYVVEYKGDYGYHTDLEQPATGTSVKVDETYSWDMTLTTTVNDAGQATSQRTLTANGTLGRTSIHNGQADLVQSCAIRALTPPGAPDLSRLTIFGGAAAGSVDVHAFLPASAVPADHQPPGGDVTVTAAPDNGNGNCAAYVGTYALGCQAGSCFDGCLGFGISPDWDAAFDLTLKGSATPSVSQAGGASQSNSTSCPTGNESGRRSIHAILTVVNPAAAGGAPPLPPAPAAAPTPPGPAPGAPPPVPAQTGTPGETTIVTGPGRPDPAALRAELGGLATRVGHKCGDGALGAIVDRRGGAGATGLERLGALGLTATELLGGHTLDCARSFAEWEATSARVAGSPTDGRYAELALPRPWRTVRAPAGACPPGAGAASCRAVRQALAAYATAAGRRASLTEVLGRVAGRAAGARGAFGQDPLAPAGLALQTAATRAYSGELVAASRVELRAARALTAAIRRAGFGRLAFGPEIRKVAGARLAGTGPPAWLVDRLTGLGLGSPARLRSDYKRLVNRAKIRLTADAGSLFRGTVAVETPAEAFFSLTLADLGRLAGAVGDGVGRAALEADVAAAAAAVDPAGRRAALERFAADAGTHEPGELGMLLQHAVTPLLR